MPSKLAPNDLAALQALRDAMMACNAAETTTLQYQHEGTYGLAHDALIHAATVLLGEHKANLLMHILIDSGEDVAYCLARVDEEIDLRPIDDPTMNMLAWDISDAIAKTYGDGHNIDVGMDAIKPALPAFLAAVHYNDIKNRCCKLLDTEWPPTEQCTATATVSRPVTAFISMEDSTSLPDLQYTVALCAQHDQEWDREVNWAARVRD